MVEVTCLAEYFVPFSFLLSGACTFLRKKYSYLDVAPEPLAFRNEELEGLLEFSFG